MNRFKNIIDKNYKYLVFFIIFLSLVIKLGLAFSLDISNDTFDYIKIAYYLDKIGFISSYLQDFYFEEPQAYLNNTVFGGGISVHDRPPLLSILALIFIKLDLSQHQLNLVLTVFTVIFSFVLLIFVNKIFILLKYSKLIRLIGIIIFSLNPHVLYYSSKFLTEVYAFTFVIVLIYLILIMKNKLNITMIFKFSFVLSLLFLTKSIYFYFPIFFLLNLTIYDFYKKNITYSKFFFKVLICYLIIISPIIYNSFYKSNTILLTRSNFMLFYCNNDFENKNIRLGLCSSERINKVFIEKNLSDNMSYVYHQKIYGKEIKKYLFENYKYLPKILLLRLKNLYHLKPNPFKEKINISDIVSILFIFLIYLTSMLYFVNINRIFQQKIYILFLISFIFYTSFLTILFWGVPRFRFPIEPFFYFLSLSYLNFKIFKKNSILI